MPRPTPKTDARTKLLEAALSVIRAKGYSATSVDELCAAAGVTKGAHGLRKAAGGLLAEMGCTENEIRAVLGHADERTTAIYTRSASRRMLAASAMKKMEGVKW